MDRKRPGGRRPAIQRPGQPPTRRPTQPRGQRPGQPRGRRPEQQAARTSWDALASWYDGWVGPEGSNFHQEVALPALLELLQPAEGEQILDVGAGQGVLAPHVARAGAKYTGVDASPRLLQLAQRHHNNDGRFLLGDAANLPLVRELSAGSFDAVTFLLSLQDMDPLDRVLASAAWALKPGGRLVMLLTHPAFRIPRQSGWGYDENRKLQYRRVDSYLSQLAVPLKPLPAKPGARGRDQESDGDRGVTRSFHRPLSVYVNTLAELGLLVDRMAEIPSHKAVGPAAERTPPDERKAAERSRLEIPLFLGLRARKIA